MGKKISEKQANFNIFEVNFHHKNCMYKQQTKLFQYLIRTQFIHANKDWPQNICAHLWIYAIGITLSVLNDISSMQYSERRKPQQIFLTLLFRST